ncbi:MAG: DNA-3-methyladenine glycosylase 2 family protein [Acidobacteria bacterium]|nr:DNA-3-methyladenine glycosylase 2 family protein [Acidobacteriota bacterium]
MQAAPAHLRQSCPRLRPVIEQVGPCRIRLRRDRFESLARIILFQQLAGPAATAIHDRLVARLPEQRLAAAGLAALGDDEFRQAGVSAQKRGYLRSLAQLTLDRQVRFQGLSARTDEEVIADLTQVKGVGVWSAHMFLMFTLGRPDVLPVGDLGVRSAMRKLFELDELPDPALCERLAQPWRPYASIASWYCWRSLDIQDPG